MADGERRGTRGRSERSMPTASAEGPAVDPNVARRRRCTRGLSDGRPSLKKQSVARNRIRAPADAANGIVGVRGRYIDELRWLNMGVRPEPAPRVCAP